MRNPLTLRVSKTGVFHDVGATSGYVGQRLTEDGDPYGRIALTSGDAEQLERYWQEGMSVLTDALKDYLEEITEDTTDGRYTFVLSVPSNFDVRLNDSLSRTCHTYLVNAMLAQWFDVSNRKDRDRYAALAADALQSLRRSLSYRLAPTKSWFTSSDD